MRKSAITHKRWWSMLELLARRLAVGIKTVVPNHPASVDVLRFSIGAILNVLFIVCFSLIGSMIFGTTKEVVIVMISFALLRQISGGVHLKSGLACIIFSTSGILLVAFLSGYLGSGPVMAMNIANVILAAIFAPSGIEKQTRIKSKYFPLLKLSATIIVSINVVLASQILAASFFVQCLTLIKFSRGRRNLI